MAKRTGHKPALLEQRETLINGQTITYTVRRSFRVKLVRLEVRPQTGLTVIVPHSYNIGQLPGLLKSKERWVSGNLAKFSHFQSLPSKKEFKFGDTVPYLGQDLELVKLENHDVAGNVMLDGNKLAVRTELFKNGILESALEQWFRTEAAKLINERTDKLGSQMGISYKRIVIRGQKTRWGSCSRKKNLSFNWKLIMAPQPVIDYVIIHELAHLKEMNHSKRFWALVAKYCPKWQEHKKWLKQHEPDLAARFCA
ncbi:MAG: M48 family metallopeptidase [Chloroflexota bacterium]|nr:MAG: M48 family metallopeptidase [Chloroflexota bacterium]